MSAQNIPIDQAAVACNPNAIAPGDRDRWMAAGLAVFAAVEEIREDPDGYACRLPADAATLLKAAEYITLDRQCCSFIRWSLVVEPGGGPAWLGMSGGEGVKEEVRQTLETTRLLREEVAQAAGFDPALRADWSFPGDTSIRVP